MNEIQDTPAEQLDAGEPLVRSKLREGYLNVNILDGTSYCKSGKLLSEFLKDQITIELSNEEDAWEFTEEREEFRPTDYIQNPRQIRTFVVKNAITNVQQTFAFDVEGYV